MTATIETPEFREAFLASDRELRLRHARVGCVLALFLMPAGSTLDLIVYPELFMPILKARWITNVFIAIVLGLLATPFGKKNVRWLGSAWVFMPAIAISWMIAISQGTASPYYAGLNLVIIIGCLLMPYTLLEAAAVCAIVFVMYLVACLAHGQSEIWSAIFYNNIYFIVLTAIIAAASCHYYHRRRVEDFRLRHELDARNRELAEMDRLKSEFFANISHELRTPLTLILGPIEDLLRQSDRLPARTSQSLQMVRQNALRLLKMINDLLEMVRLDARRAAHSHQRTRVDLARLVPGIADSVRHLAHDKGLALEAKGDDELIVAGDASGLEKVFLNLLTNAIKFTDAGGTITASWARDDNHARIEVADTGIGIARDNLPHIFDRFRQVDGSATRKFRGLGLGLALVKELVDEHDGKLDVDSDPGRGTRFIITLPLAGESTPATAPAPSEHSNGDKAPPADPMVAPLDAADAIAFEAAETDDALEDVGQGEHRVLVVDDEPDMRRFIVSILADDYRVQQAADGETGLAKALDQPPDLIVLDMMLPGLDGLEVCKRMRADDSLNDTRIIMLTARADEQTKLTALQRGADDFLTKPFSSIEVRTRIANLLRTLTLQRELRRHNEELQRIIRELNATRAQLVQSEKMNALGSLAAGLLHEINNPLNYALTALQLLEDDLDAPADELRDTLNDVGDGMKRIRDIITDLRSFAYPEHRQAAQQVPARDIIQTARRFTSHLCGDLAIDQQVDEHALAWGSHSQLTQVMVNLISNAARAVEEVRDNREPRVSIAARVEDDRCVITVRDNGVGIEPDKLARIFDPFYTTQDVGRGMGLGLSVSHTIVTQHHGAMSVRSEPDQWTEVRVELPTEEPETQNRHDHDEHPPRTIAQNAGANPLR